MVQMDVWYNYNRDYDRVADTKAKIDESGLTVDIYRGRSTTILYENVPAALSLRNNIPNYAQTAGSSGRFNDATFIFMPGVDIRPGDRVVTNNGYPFSVTFVNPEQRWEIEAQVITFANSGQPTPN